MKSATTLTCGLDFAGLIEGDTTGWGELMEAIDAGKLCRVPKWVYDYFLGVLPPMRMIPRGFVFVEGADIPTIFLNWSGGFWAWRGRGASVDDCILEMQGLIRLNVEQPTESSTETPAMRQYRRFKEQHPECILLFRMGDFYEVFYDDAVKVAKVLHLTLTNRGEMPMAGIPAHAIDTMLRRMIEQGFRVAICEKMA